MDPNQPTRRMVEVPTQRVFDIFWGAYLTAPRATPRSFDLVRSDAKLSAALQEISTQREGQGPIERELTAPTKIILGAVEFRSLLTYIEHCPWTPIAAVDAVTAADMLIHAPEA